MTVRRYDDDPELVLAARQGDGAAFTTLFRRWFDPCLDVARRIVHDQDIAAEVAQETFLVAWRQLDTLRDPSAFGGWVLRTARNKALNRLDRERRSVAVDQEDDPVLAGLEAGDDVERDAASLDQQRLLWAASAALGERDASVLDLHLRHGCDAAEIAAALDVTPNNAHQLLFRMKGRLAGAIRAWVLFKGGDPACHGLREALRAAGATSFSAATVKVVDRHVKACEDCGRRQAAILAPEVMFAAVPALPVAGLVRDRVAAALRDGGVPLGPEATTAAPPGEAGRGDVGGSDASGSDVGGTDGARPPQGADGPAPTPGVAAVGGGHAAAGDAPDVDQASALPRRDRRRLLVVGGIVAVVLLVAGVVALAVTRDDEVAVSEETQTATTTAAPEVRSGTSAPTTSTTTTVPAEPTPATSAPAVATPTAPPTTDAPSTAPPVTETPTTTTTAPPVAAPTIISFVVTPDSAPGGRCPAGQWASSLAWRTSGATSIVANAPGATAPVAGGPFGVAVGCTLSPGAPWTLTAIGPGGTASATR